MSENILRIPEKEYETLRVLMIEALTNTKSDGKCKCICCKGLSVLAKRIVEYNENDELVEAKYTK